MVQGGSIALKPKLQGDPSRHKAVGTATFLSVDKP